MAEELKSGVLSHVQIRERALIEDTDPELAASNAKKAADLDMTRHMREGEQAWTHVIMRKHPTEGDSLIGSDEGQATRFLSLDRAKEALAENKDSDCTYLVLSVVHEE